VRVSISMLGIQRTSAKTVLSNIPRLGAHRFGDRLLAVKP
jgi:hypothetical protein